MGALAARVPLLVVLATIVTLSMMVPALHALVRDDHPESRAFFYASLLLTAFVAAIGTATARRRSQNITRSHLIALLSAFTLLPALAAVPFAEAVTSTRFLNAYIEMVAAATTTGGSLFATDRLSETAHLWRAMVAWQGGLLIWVAAAAILAPLRLGGFEVTLADSSGLDRRADGASPESRIARAAAVLVPSYAALTLTLWALLAAFGASPTEAAIHAMSTLSTSGITMGGVAGSPAGLAGEAAIFAFLVFAVSRQTFTTDLRPGQSLDLLDDREIRIAFGIVVLASILLFARHWAGAYEVDATADAGAALRALWGSAFTVLSFLTTTGFESAEWQTARAWSGLDSPTVMLLGLAMFGGGVATTAGGVKLLRIYALYAHGRREMNLLVHPSSMAGGRGAVRRMSARGIEAAWVFFMLFATTIAVFTLALAATGLDFETALILAVAGLSTTGPLAESVTAPTGGLNAFPDAAKCIWAAAMVVGRLEALALIALFNPDFWRG